MSKKKKRKPRLFKRTRRASGHPMGNLLNGFFESIIDDALTDLSDRLADMAEGRAERTTFKEESRRRREPKETNREKVIRGAYRFLGCSPYDTEDEIVKVYREKAKKLHPDKGGDEEEFKTLQFAYSVVRDDAKHRRS